MNISTLNRLAMTVVIGAAIAAISFPVEARPLPLAPSEQQADDKRDRDDDKYDRRDDRSDRKTQQQREKEQKARIRQDQQNLARYRQVIARRQALAERDAQRLQQQRRQAHYEYQRSYYENLRKQRERVQSSRYDYDNDPYYRTPPTYRYRRAGRYYQTNQYGADILRQALNYGYQQGYQAGRADRRDRWRFDYRQSFAYEDANYGYEGRYVRQDEYNYYFREGFRRGYDDGYYDRRFYGRHVDGSDSLLGAVLIAILALEVLD